MKIDGLRYWLHERAGVAPCIQQCRNENQRILAITSNMPAALFLSRSRPLSKEQANMELLREDEGRISIRAEDVERAVWALWPDATHASVGGDGKVHVFMPGALAVWQDSYLDSLRETIS